MQTIVFLAVVFGKVGGPADGKPNQMAPALIVVPASLAVFDFTHLI